MRVLKVALAVILIGAGVYFGLPPGYTLFERVLSACAAAAVVGYATYVTSRTQRGSAGRK